MSFGNHLITIVILLFVFFLLSAFSSLAINDLPPPSVSSLEGHPLWAYHQQQVRIRGFWYPLTSEQGILAPHPHLKSCCLASLSKIGQQVLVKGEVASFSSQKAMTVEGIFKIAPLYNEEGKLVQFYLLEQAKEISSFHFPFSSLLLLAGGTSFALFFYWIKRKSLLKSTPTNI